MYVGSVTRTEQGEEIKMSAVTGKPGVGDEPSEDNTYSKYTPSASLTINVTNPALFGKINPGERYYLDFTKAEA